VQLFDPMVNLAVDAKFVDEPQLRATASQMVVALVSLCDATRSAGNGPYKPIAGPSAGRAPGGRRERARQLWLLGVLGAFVAALIACLFVQTSSKTSSGRHGRERPRPGEIDAINSRSRTTRRSRRA